MLFALTAGDRWAILTRRACPRCGSVLTARAHRKTLQDEALAAIHLFPYRCGRCSARFRANALLRTLGERPWSADPRRAVIPKRWVRRGAVSSAAWPGVIVIAILGLVAAFALRTLFPFAR